MTVAITEWADKNLHPELFPKSNFSADGGIRISDGIAGTDKGIFTKKCLIKNNKQTAVINITRQRMLKNFHLWT